ncbi:cobyric acid synthase [Arenicella xantha]
MVQGCTSDAGKSVMVAGICRVLARRGVQVAPFKPQNMALNSAVTEDGGEIGRAQALQAQACYLPARTDFNPVLLKPSSDTGAQVIIHGQAIGAMQATEFHDYKKVAMNAVLQSHQRLQNTYSAIVVEGAGSPAEINLRNGDIANMGFAEAVDCPVVLIADIDRGGVFAHLVGTLALLSESEQARVVGFIINRFRGDVSILQPGLDWLEAKTNKPVLGVVPFLTNLYLDAEDAISSTQTEMADDGLADNMPLKVVVPVVSRISNHTDFDALRLNPSVDLQFVPINQTPPAADLIILPGSKSVISDLRSLKSNDWDAHLKRHLRYGGKLIGICGGYQMLGHTISDPSGVESDQPADHESGFGLLNIQTKLAPHKQLKQVQGQFINLGNAPARFQGYEIHCGTTTSDAEPMLQFENGETAGSISPDQLILGCYIHGLFDTPSACDALLNWAGAQHGNAVDLDVIREQQLNRLADCLEETLPATFWSKFAGSGNLRQDTA